MVTRRELVQLAGSGGLAGALGGCTTDERDCDPEEDVACFDYVYQGFDDALDQLCIVRVGGSPLPAGEVHITNVALAYPPEPTYGRTLTWSEVTDLEPAQRIGNEAVRVGIGHTSTVYLLWRNDSTEITLEAIPRGGEDRPHSDSSLDVQNCG